MKNTSIFIIKRLLKEYGIKVDEKELEFQHQSHPSFPSLHSLTGVLDHFRIENLALEVPNDIETLKKLPDSFIAYIKDERSDNFVFVSKNEDSVQLVFEDKKTKKIYFEEFCDIWTGVIVAVEKDQNIISEPKTFLRLLTKGLFAISLFVLSALFFSYKPSLFQAIHFLLSFVGLGISIVIVKHELGLDSKIADKFCSGNIEKINCNDVLNSKAASFLGVIKLSDIGIVYFMALIISWLFIAINNANYSALILITILATPFTFYSIIYQYFVVKKWCPLCLSIVLTLWLQVIALYFVNLEILKFNLEIAGVGLILFSFLLTISLWQFILPKLKKEQELKKLKIEYFKFKRNYNIFNALISRSTPVNTTIDDAEEIVLGNKSDDAKLKVVVITNPLCGHCSSSHKLVKQLLELQDNNIQIRIRFNVNTKDEKSIAVKIALRLIELYHRKGEQKCLTAMHDIYGNLSTLSWLEKWGEVHNRKYFDILVAEKEWCQKNNINFTPEILINGRSFPNEYDRSDLTFFINDIIEEENQEIEEFAHEFE